MIALWRRKNKVVATSPVKRNLNQPGGILIPESVTYASCIEAARAAIAKAEGM